MEVGDIEKEIVAQASERHHAGYGNTTIESGAYILHFCSLAVRILH